MTDHPAPLDLVAANTDYADRFDAGDLGAPPRRQLAVLTCMDARIVPHEVLGLDNGDVHVLRNAGGRVTDDALRSLMVSTRLLGVRQVAVMHHTDCGNSGTDDELAAKLRDAGVDDPPRPLHGSPDTEGGVREDVARLRDSGLLAEGTAVAGYVYDVHSGRVTSVDTA